MWLWELTFSKTQTLQSDVFIVNYVTQVYTTKMVNMYFIHEKYLVILATYLSMKATNVYVNFSHMQTPCLEYVVKCTAK
jgi:hypothetical protein